MQLETRKKKTSGKIITFIDVDDIWLAHKLERQVEYFFKTNLLKLFIRITLLKKILGINFKNIKFRGILLMAILLKTC